MYSVNLPQEVDTVNIDFVTPPGASRQPYHHGDLHRALVSAATDLAREGGPSAIVLREAARRVGVSPNAAYRHFDSLPDLVDAVAFASLSTLARSMEAELAKCRPGADPGAEAIDRMGAVGRGYIHFALKEPGLFATAFAGRPGEVSGEEPLGVGDSGLNPGELLERALDGMLEAGVLDAADRETAAINAWAAVHGLSELLLGPLAAETSATRDVLIDAFLDLVCRGLVSRDS